MTMVSRFPIAWVYYHWPHPRAGWMRADGPFVPFITAGRTTEHQSELLYYPLMMMTMMMVADKLNWGSDKIITSALCAYFGAPQRMDGLPHIHTNTSYLLDWDPARARTPTHIHISMAPLNDLIRGFSWPFGERWLDRGGGEHRFPPNLYVLNDGTINSIISVRAGCEFTFADVSTMRQLFGPFMRANDAKLDLKVDSIFWNRFVPGTDNDKAHVAMINIDWMVLNGPNFHSNVAWPTNYCFIIYYFSTEPMMPMHIYKAVSHHITQLFTL